MASSSSMGAFLVAAKLSQPPAEVVQDRREPPVVVEPSELTGGCATDGNRRLEVAGLERGLHADEPDHAESPVVVVGAELLLGVGQQRL